MLRSITVAAIAALLVAGCGKSESTSKPGTSTTGGHGQVGHTTTPPPNNPGGTQPASTDDPRKPPTDTDSGKGGWIPVAVPDSMKDQDYATVVHVVKLKGAVTVINLDRYMVDRTDHGSSTGSSISAFDKIEPKTSWELVGGGIMDKMKDAPEKTDLYFRVEGKRTMDKKFVSPPGTAGEKHEWTIRIDKVVWEKNETVYTHEVTILEEELWDNYLATIDGTIDLASALKMWKGYSKTADDLGLILGDRDRDRTKKPYDRLVTALEHISESQAVIDKKGGGLDEATAWLRCLFEWSHFPPSVVSGDVENDEREKKARESLTGRVKLIENQLRDRLKTGGITIAASDVAGLLKATDGTMLQKFCVFAAEAGKCELSAQAALAIFGSEEKDDWKATTLSLLKNAVSNNPDFFAGWAPDALKAFPAKLKDAVLPFTKGQLIPTRNAVSIVEAVRKHGAGVTFSPTLDEIVSELKKK